MNAAIPDEVRAAFDKWTKADKWRSALTNEEKGRLGAARRDLNRVLRRHGLRYDDVAPHVY